LGQWTFHELSGNLIPEDYRYDINASMSKTWQLFDYLTAPFWNKGAMGMLVVPHTFSTPNIQNGSSNSFELSFWF
jgi:hypothetical protein